MIDVITNKIKVKGHFDIFQGYDGDSWYSIVELILKNIGISFPILSDIDSEIDSLLTTLFRRRTYDMDLVIKNCKQPIAQS